MAAKPKVAHIDYIGHVSLWAVIDAKGENVAAYRTRQAAQRHANRLNGEAKPFTRPGLHKLECPDCAAYVYATVAQLEAHGMPVCPCGAAYVPDELELAFLLGLYDAPVVAEFEQRTHRSELAQQRRIGWMEAQRRHAAGTLNPMSVKAADEMRAERRARARSNRLSAIMPKPEPMPF